MEWYPLVLLPRKQCPGIVFQDVSVVAGGMLVFFSQELEVGAVGGAQEISLMAGSSENNK